MANWFCSVFNVVCRKSLSGPRCRSELIDSAWVVIVPGKKCIKKHNIYIYIYIYIYIESDDDLYDAESEEEDNNDNEENWP